MEQFGGRFYHALYSQTTLSHDASQGAGTQRIKTEFCIILG